MTSSSSSNSTATAASTSTTTKSEAPSSSFTTWVFSFFTTLLGAILGCIDWIVGLLGVALSCCNQQGFAVKMGTQGYGDLAGPLNAQAHLLEEIENPDFIQKRLRLDPQTVVWTKWTSPVWQRWLGLRMMEATFASPAAAGLLPTVAQQGHFWYIQPSNSKKKSQTTVIVLPSTGEEHIFPRLVLSWYWAVVHGYSSILLTAPFYGCRKPASQNLFFIDTMADMITQLLVLCQESVALTAHAMQEDHKVILTGFSIGGGMSVFSAALAAASGCDRNRLGVVPYVGATDPSCVVQGMFASLCDWSALVKDSPDHPSIGTVQTTAVQILQECIANFDTLVRRTMVTVGEQQENDNHDSSNNNNPYLVKAATLVDMSHDKFFPRHAKAQLRAQVYTIAQQVVQAIEVPGGHITGALVRPWVHARAVVQTVQAMEAATQQQQNKPHQD